MPYNVRQYEVPQGFFGAADGNVVSLDDQKRLQAYRLYEDLYNNNPNSIKIQLRGDSVPIYMPSGKKIVNATNRFLGKNMEYFVEPKNKDGNDLDEGTRAILETTLANLYKREAVKRKFSSQKKWGLIKADAGFMLYGDPNKPQGERISVYEVDPAQVFAIEDDEARLVGYHVVELVKDPREDKKSGKQVVKRSTWRRERDQLGNFTNVVTHEVSHWSVGKWDDRFLDDDDMERVQHGDLEDQDPDPLPSPISRLPIYMWHNDSPPGSTWGTSILSGLETLIFGINQSITDEDLTLVMQGLGMYTTNAAPPVDDAGNILSWNVGPGQVIETAENQEFTRVTGVSDVSPYQDHINMMDDKGLAESSGTPAVAIGRVDVSIAESGVALKLQFDPLLAANADRELELYTVMDQFHHDLVTMWFAAYEEINPNNAVVSTVFDDPMPVNKDQVIQDTVLLRTSNLILTEMAVDKLSEIGWKYPPGMSVQEIVQALQAQAQGDAAALDPFAAAGGSGEPTDGTGEFGEDPEIEDSTTIDLGVT